MNLVVVGFVLQLVNGLLPVCGQDIAIIAIKSLADLKEPSELRVSNVWLDGSHSPRCQRRAQVQGCSRAEQQPTLATVRQGATLHPFMRL